MAYSTGIIGTTQPAVDLMNAIDAAITAAGGAWSFVEQWTSSGGTIYRVYKCSGAVNSIGSDFYVAFSRTSATSNVTVQMFEQWNTTTKQFTDPVPAFQGGATANGSFSVPTAKYTTGFSALLDTASPNTLNLTITMATGSTNNYFISVTNDRLIVSNGTTTTANTGVYVGVYDRFQTAAIDPMPIVMMNLQTQTTAQSATAAALVGGYTREPLQSVQRNANWLYATQLWGVPVSGATAAVKETLSNQWWPLKVALFSDDQRGGSGFVVFRGLMKDVLYQDTPSPIIGDTMSVDGVTYVRLGTGSTRAFWLNTAA